MNKTVTECRAMLAMLAHRALICLGLQAAVEESYHQADSLQTQTRAEQLFVSDLIVQTSLLQVKIKTVQNIWCLETCFLLLQLYSHSI